MKFISASYLLENGATILNYSINTTQHVRYSDDLPVYKAWHEAEKNIQYTISKSNDDQTYKRIGISKSDSQSVVHPKQDSTVTEWGGSQFLDKELNTADSTYYLVEGYIGNEDERNRRVVYRQKIVVPPTKTIQINNLYNAPKSKQLEISLSSPTNDKVNCMVSDMSGRVLLQQQTLLSEGHNNFILTCDALLTGVYVLSIQQNGRTVSRKFMVMN